MTSSLDMEIGQIYTLEIGGCDSIVSSDESVVTVTNNRFVTAVGTGRAIVTATATVGGQLCEARLPVGVRHTPVQGVFITNS